jgi:CBS domain-containing protein
MGKQVKDVMTHTVVHVKPSTPFKEIVKLMDAFRASALPVVDEGGHVVGVVSEAELLVKEAYAPHHEGERALDRWRHRTERLMAEGITAGQIMDTRAVKIEPEADVSEAARLMYEHHIIRIPVVDEGGHVVGMVSWRDLLDLFLRADGEIRRDAVAFVEKTLCVPPHTVAVAVSDGVVTLTGQLEHVGLKPTVIDHIRSIEGVIAVVDHLTVARDDVTGRAATA